MKGAEKLVLRGARSKDSNAIIQRLELIYLREEEAVRVAAGSTLFLLEPEEIPDSNRAFNACSDDLPRWLMILQCEELLRVTASDDCELLFIDAEYADGAVQTPEDYVLVDSETARLAFQFDLQQQL